MRTFLLILTMILSIANGQMAFSEPVNKETDFQTAPVRVDGVVLFPVRGLASYPARERAGAIEKRIEAISDDPAVKVGSIDTVETDHSTDIMVSNRLIMSVFDADAQHDNVSRQVLAELYASKIRGAVDKYRGDRSTHNILWNVGSATGATLALVIIILLLRWGYRKLISLIESRLAAKIRELQDKSHDIVRTEWIWGSIRGSLTTTRLILVFVLVLFYVDLVLGFFPWTRSYAVPLLELVIKPLKSILLSVLDYFPSLVFLIIVIMVMRYVLKILRTFFLSIQQGKIKISGFDAEWSIPTYKIVRVAVIAFTVVVSYPYIPGSESPAFKGVSLFLGVVFSLGSSSSISQIVSGYLVIFSRAFKVGDRVKIGTQMGDVIEMRLLVTHLRTIKNEEIIIPNSTILNTEVMNYSSLARKGGLILHTSVTIGYDTPWRQIHALLLMAAGRTPGLLREPRPFILQTALNDFYVSYELNAYTDRPIDMVDIYSDLHQKILDTFNEFGVQIMSPHYLGDPKEAKIVPKEKWHQSPAKPDDVAGPR